MADNIEITAGTGTPVATDDVGGVHYQKIKQVFGGDDAAVGGLTYFRDTSVDNSEQVLKGTPGLLFFIEVVNPNTSDCWLQLYDESGTVTPGTTVPKLSLFVPAGNGVSSGATSQTWRIPFVFANTIKYAATTTTTGGSNPSSALVLNGGYI